MEHSHDLEDPRKRPRYFLLRMEPELKARLAKAADEEGATIRDLALYAIEQMLDTRDAKIARPRTQAGSRKPHGEEIPGDHGVAGGRRPHRG